MGFTNYSWGLAHALGLFSAWMAPAATVGLYLMSDAHLARKVSGPVEKLELLIPEVLCFQPHVFEPHVFEPHIRCILIKKSEWSNGNTQHSQSGGCEFKPSWVQQSFLFFLNYKLKHYVLLETNTFSGGGTQLLDSLVCRVEMQGPRVHLPRWIRAPGKLASFWHYFVYNYTVHHTT